MYLVRKALQAVEQIRVGENPPDTKSDYGGSGLQTPVSQPSGHSPSPFYNVGGDAIGPPPPFFNPGAHGAPAVFDFGAPGPGFASFGAPAPMPHFNDTNMAPAQFFDSAPPMMMPPPPSSGMPDLNGVVPGMNGALPSMPYYGGPPPQVESFGTPFLPMPDLTGSPQTAVGALPPMAPSFAPTTAAAASVSNAPSATDPFATAPITTPIDSRSFDVNGGQSLDPISNSVALGAGEAVTNDLENDIPLDDAELTIDEAELPIDETDLSLDDAELPETDDMLTEIAEIPAEDAELSDVETEIINDVAQPVDLEQTSLVDDEAAPDLKESEDKLTVDAELKDAAKDLTQPDLEVLV